MSSSCAPSQANQVQCKYCHKQILVKNYPRHLKEKHKSCDQNDRSGKGSQTITSFFGGKRSNNNEEDLNNSETNRKRHCSGDSAAHIDDENANGSEDISDEVLVKNIETAEDLREGIERDEQNGPLAVEEIIQSNNNQDHIRLLQEIKTAVESNQSKLDLVLKGNFGNRGEGDGNVKQKEDADASLGLELIQKFREARSIKDIENLGFSFEDGILSCNICEEMFTFDEEETDFTDKILSSQFRGLKKRVKKHLVTSKHIDKVTEKEEEDKQKVRIMSKNETAGMNVGRAAYACMKLRRSKREFETDIYLLKTAGAEVGNINHSENFLGKLRPYVSQSVKALVNNFFSSPTIPTGFCPPVAFTADGATFKRRCRQFHGVNVVVPDSQMLIESISLGQDVLTEGKSGDLLVKSINEQLMKHQISSEQISSGVFDGAYFHVGVHKLLRTYHNRSENSLHFVWDPMHKLGLVDKHLTGDNSKDFPWIGKLCNLAVRIIKKFQWGNEHEKLRSATENMDILLYNLQFFSETRFANSKRLVFKNLFLMTEAVVGVLENEIIEDLQNRYNLEAADQQIRRKGQEARELKGAFLNQQTILLLAGLTDIYNIFGTLVNISQEYTLFPHQRLQKFDKTVEKMKSINDHLNVTDCSEKNCLMKYYHQSCLSLFKDGKIQNVFIPDRFPTKAAGLNTTTRSRGTTRRIIVNDDTEEEGFDNVEDSGEFYKNMNERLKVFANKLAEKISSDVIDFKDRLLINKTREILDIPKILVEMKESKLTPEIFAVASYPTFAEATKAMDVPSLEVISEEVIRNQYRNFIIKIGNMFEGLSVEDLRDIDSREVFRKMFSTKDKLYEDVQVVLHISAVAATKSSCESVLESYVSQYEYTSNQRKNFGEEGINDTFEIVKNGPCISKCDKVVRMSLHKYFEEKNVIGWHFHTKSPFNTSKTVTKIQNKSSSLPFMD